jgi:predicted ABC-type ATPase
VASRSAPNVPSLWIIAGANGSGKSSAYTGSTIADLSGSVWIINPDALSKRIADHDHIPLNPDANLEAVRRIEEWLYASVRAHQTVGVETVLSSDKYRRLVTTAKAHGFRVRLMYVYLDSADLNLERVQARVEKGGHEVEEVKVRSRRVRSFQQLAWFFEHADDVQIYDNSGAEPQLIVEKRDGEVIVYDLPIQEVRDALVAAAPGVEATFEGWPR